MPILDELSKKMAAGQHLEQEEASQAARALASVDESFESKKDFLVKLSEKGETAEEVTAFATTFRSLARDTQLSDYADRAIDIVGTGGSGTGSYNISSVAAITVASAGVPVLKHGNRAVTSKSGSADFLSLLGVPQNPPIELLKQSVQELSFCFFFAPSFHPAFKEIVPVRKALAEEGRPTIFNVLGPLINPARPAFQLLGVSKERWVKPLSKTLHQLGLKRGLCVYADIGEGKGVDEFSCVGENTVCGFGDFSGIEAVWRPRTLGLAECAVEDILGGSPQENFETLKVILAGKGKRGLVDTIAINAGAALWIAGQAEDIRIGIQKAKELLLGGAVAEWIDKAQTFYSSVETAK